MNEGNNSSPALDISHLIRNRLTSIALCADSLQSDLIAGLSAEQKREFGIIQSSIAEIKSVLDQMAASFHMERLALKQLRRQSEHVGYAAPQRLEATLSGLSTAANELTDPPGIFMK